VEDDSDGMPHAGAHAADAVAEVHAVIALRALYRPVMDREGHRIALPKRDDLGAERSIATWIGKARLP
jgi:hypothetical protein